MCRSVVVLLGAPSHRGAEPRTRRAAPRHATPHRAAPRRTAAPPRRTAAPPPRRAAAPRPCTTTARGSAAHCPRVPCGSHATRGLRTRGRIALAQVRALSLNSGALGRSPGAFSPSPALSAQVQRLWLKSSTFQPSPGVLGPSPGVLGQVQVPQAKSRRFCPNPAQNPKSST